VPRRNAKRHQANWLRAYGSPERVQWVQSLPCTVCRDTPSQNAHSKTAGTGRKADAETIIPLFAPCHGELHRVGVQTFEVCYVITLADAAREAGLQF
jgi:hypothetical protein